MKATFHQPGFLGGEWAPSAQGRSDKPDYHTALSLCRNAQPVETGAYVRRSGTQGIMPTRNRNYAKLLPLESGSALPYVMEFTTGYLRFVFGETPVFTNDSQVITASSVSSGKLTLTTTSAHGWSVGDDVMIWFPIDYPIADQGIYRGLVLQALSGTTGSTLVLGDERGNPFTINSNITIVALPSPAPVVWHLQQYGSTPYTTNLQNLRAINTDSSAIILSSAVAPHQVQITTAASGVSDPVFALSALTFVDGPYDVPTPGGGAVSGFTGTITYTPNDGTTFISTDVGRHIRLFSEPPVWASGTTYANGNFVTYPAGTNQYWQSMAGSNTGNTPGTTPIVAGVPTTYWVPAPFAAQWVWGTIATQSGTSCTIALDPSSGVSAENGGASGTIPSVNGTTITNCMLGLFDGVVPYPLCGTYNEGRFALAGSIGNRIDLSMSNAINQFSPTDQYGNVNDNNAISEIIQSPASNPIYWMEPDQSGVLIGTLKGEWLLHASTLGDPITPTTVQIKRVTKYGCANMEPRQVGQSLVFAQRYRRHLFEYTADAITSRFSGKPMNDDALHLSHSGIEELAYTEEPTPVVWARMADGTLAGVTYRRISHFITEAPVFEAWHGHNIGDTRFVEALCGSADSGGGDTACQILLPNSALPVDVTPLGDRLYLVTNDQPDSLGNTPANRMIEVLQPVMEDDDAFQAGWFADQAPGQGKHVVAFDTAQTDLFCTPMGGISGSDSVTSPPDIGSRATTTPGTTIPAPGVAGRSAILAALTGVYFNGYSALTFRRMPGKQANANSFTMSVWLNPQTQDTIGVLGGNGSSPSAVGQGLILGADPYLVQTGSTAGGLASAPGSDAGAFTNISTSGPTPGVTNMAGVGPVTATDGTVLVSAGTHFWAKFNGAFPIAAPAGTTTAVYAFAVIKPGQDTTSPNGLTFIGETNGIGGQYGAVLPLSETYYANDTFNTDPSAFLDKGWYNLLVSMTITATGTVNTPPTASTASTVHLQVYINETAVYDGTVGDGFAGVAPAGFHYIEPSKFPWANLVNWIIGGRMQAFNAGGTFGAFGGFQSTIPSDGLGYIGGMTELWVAPGQYLDFSVSGNRQKFHCADITNLTYAPVDLGASGSTPTGTAPAIYCTGTAKLFQINRASKNLALTVYNNYPDAQHTFAQLTPPIYLDPWVGPVPS